MRLIQPYPQHNSPVCISANNRENSSVPIYFVRHRYAHHAPASGYDRLCDYVGKSIPLPRYYYWLGETVFRPFCLANARWGGHFEYSRYDCIMELATIQHYLTHFDSIYHFIYAEKSFKLMHRYIGRNNNRIIGTIHHPPEHNEWLFRKLDHFRAFDHLLVMSEDQIPYWQNITQRDNISFLPHGIDVEYYTAGEKQRDEVIRCIFVGTHERDFDNLPSIVAAILQAYSGTEFHMVSADARCRDIADEYSRAYWHYRIPEKEYLTILRHADLMVLPLVCSTACNAVVEALACGVPVITNVGGIESYLTPKCSVCVPLGCPDRLIQAALNIIQDKPRLREMSIAARKQALSLSWQAVARQLVVLCQRLLA